MERKEEEYTKKISSPLMETFDYVPTFPENHPRLNPISENHIIRNPINQNHFFQNPISENNKSDPFFHQQSFGSMELGYNHVLDEGFSRERVETDLSRLTLSTPPRQSQFQFSNLVHDHGGFAADPHVGIGSHQLSYQQFKQLHRMRIESAVRGQMGFYGRPNGVPFLGNGGFQDTLPRSNSSVFPSYGQLGNNGTRTLAATRNHGASSCSHNRGRSINGLRMESFKPFRSSLNDNDIHFIGNLEDLKRQVILLAKDQYGCRLLQRKFNEGKQDEVEIILSEVKDHLHELMMDQFGNYFIQRIFQESNAGQMTEFLTLVIRNEQKLKDVCVDTHGTRAIQKLLEHLQTRQHISLVISALEHIIVTLSKSLNGNHVIQQCLKLFSREHQKLLLDEIAQNCLDIATDMKGCCLIQYCLDHADIGALEHLVAEIVAYALVLAESPYGNYVVQCAIGKNQPSLTENIMMQLIGKYVQLSMDKYGSHVVEFLLKYADEAHASMIIEEIMTSYSFLNVVQDPHGNYVVQTALQESKRMATPTIHWTLSTLIMNNYASLHSHPHGKRVLASARGSRPRV
ncbi:Pumilio-like protein [Quillaja saponaria]|uniref:Pumilio-like protein n=1 Tax=Quillaja saponaria TaxID=32244 RepID=A0AAD7M0C4_QUISA|nr:Pumilio-like protein [Quillaja saponaria]